jgi:hypothetical protein
MKPASSPVNAIRTMEDSSGVVTFDSAWAIEMRAATPEALSSAPL